MSAFCLLQIHVKDPATLKEYTDAAPATVKAFGGELVFRGEVSEVLTGEPTHDSAVALRFPNSNSAKRWYQSPEYQKLAKIRDASADVVVTLYDEPGFF